MVKKEEDKNPKNKKKESGKKSENKKESSKKTEKKKEEENSKDLKKKTSEKKVDQKQPSKEITKQDKQLRNFLIVLGVIALLIAGFYVLVNSSPKFEYKGIEFNTVQQGEIIMYKTLLPLYNSQGEKEVNHRFYLRNHPKEIKDIPVPEELELKRLVIINNSDNIICQGDGNIAVANLKQLYSVMGAKIWDASSLNESYRKCDKEGRYNYLDIKRGNKTEIIKKGPACYDLTFKDCEVLDVTERYMLKMFVQTRDSKFPVSNIQNKK